MNPTLLGSVSIIFAIFLMAVQDILIKGMTTALGLWQLLALRSPLVVVLLVMIIVIMPKTRLSRSFRDALGGWATLRSLFLVSMFVSMYMSFPYFKLAEFGAAFFTAPIWTAIMASIFLKERVGPQGWLAVALGFLGVVIVSNLGTDVFKLAILLPVFSGFSYSCAAVLTRAHLVEKDTLGLALSMNLVLLAFGLVATGVLSVIGLNSDVVAQAPFLLSDWISVGRFDWSLLAIMALIMVGITTLLPLAYQLAPAVLIGTLEYIYLLYAGVMAYIFLGETLDYKTIAGMVLLVVAGVLVASRRQPAASPVVPAT